MTHKRSSAETSRASDARPAGETLDAGSDHDTSERKRVERSLEQLSRAVNASGDVVLMTDRDGLITSINPRFTELYGYRPEEVVGKVTPRILKSGKQSQAVYEEFWETILRGELFRGEVINRSKDGRLIYVEETVNPFDDERGLLAGFLAIQRDVTERRQALESLRESEERYHSIVEQAAEGMITYDAETLRIIDVNPAYRRLLGYTREEMNGLSLYDLVAHPRADVDGFVERVRREKAVWIGERKHRRKDGSEVDVEVSSSLASMSGRDALLVVIRDITERKKSELSQRVTEERLRALTEATSEGIVFHEQGTILDVNPALVSMFGYEGASELIGRGLLEFVAPESRERVLAEIQSGRSNAYRALGLRKDGSVFPVEAAARSYNYQGRTVRVASIRDISEQRKAEEDLRSLHERYVRFFMEDLTGSFISTPAGRLVACNPAFVRIFGFASVEEALATSVEALYRSPEERRKLLSRLLRDRKLEYYDMRAIKRDGTPLHLVANIHGRFDERGQLYEIQGYLFDDTRRRQLEETLLQAQKLDSIGTLASGIAHDFNNILAIILGNASMLERIKCDPSMVSQRADTLVKAAQRGAALVKQILTFARKTESAFEQHDLNVTVKEVFKVMQETFPKTIDIRIALHERLPSVHADATQAQQVLLNLCVNARDAMPMGGTLTVTTASTTGHRISERFPNVRAPEYVTLSVEDTGVGMDEQTRLRVFEPFFTTKVPGQGTGLGLAVAHGIVQAHSGFVDVESAPGKGTKFVVYLPVAQTTELEYESAQQIPDSAPSGTETILIVEDEEQVRELLLAVLHSKGYRVLAAEDGPHAVRLYGERRPDIDLVISDMGLPGLSGTDVFRQIRRINPAAKVIMVSGFVEPAVKADLLRSGVVDFILKPFSNEELLTRVRRVIDGEVPNPRSLW